MKKILCGFLLIMFGIMSFSMAYTPDNYDIQKMQTIRIQLDKVLTSNEKIWDYYFQFKLLNGKFSDDKQLNYILGTFEEYLYEKLQANKKSIKENSLEFRKSFFNIEANSHTGMLDTLSGIKILPQCLEYYDLIDDISFAYDFPTELVISTWYREYTCGYGLPSNGNGPFQIISNDYGTGDISETKFVQTVIDFIEFSKGKRNSYNNKVDLNIGYNGFSKESIINHMALYNGGYIQSGVVIPNNPKYIFDNYSDTFSGAIKDGVFTQFMKLIEMNIKS